MRNIAIIIALAGITIFAAGCDKCEDLLKLEEDNNKLDKEIGTLLKEEKKEDAMKKRDTLKKNCEEAGKMGTMTCKRKGKEKEEEISSEKIKRDCDAIVKKHKFE